MKLLFSLLLACSGDPALAEPPADPPAPSAPVEAPSPPALPAATGSSTAKEELGAWVEAVRSGEIEAILARVGEPIVFRAKMVPGRPAEETLDREGLRAAMADNEGKLLGLNKHHMLPRPEDLKSESAERVVAVDPHCPAVTWTFARRADRWFLAEVAFTLLDC